MLPRPRQSYHPFVIVAFYLHILPAQLLSQIPRSTRHDWLSKPVTELFGYEWYCQNQHFFKTLQEVATTRKLLKINKALLRIIAIQRFIKEYRSHIHSSFSNVNVVILNNIHKVSELLGCSFCLKLIQLTHRQLRQLKQKVCTKSLFSLCIPKHTTQLLQREVNTIKKYCEDISYIRWPLASVYHQIIRDKAAQFHISTFYKYVTHLQLKRVTTSKRRKNHTKGIRASCPLQLLHADITVFRTADNLKACIYLVQDNFSRAILAFTVNVSCKAAVMMELIRNVYTHYLQPAALDHWQLMTDEGAENFGAVQDFLASTQNPSLKHIIAQRDVEFSNSMIEAANKNLKYRFLYHMPIANFNDLCRCVPEAINDFNNRPHDVLGGLTPLEVLNGKITDKNAEAVYRKAATIKRIAQNKQQQCCNYSF